MITQQSFRKLGQLLNDFAILHFPFMFTLTVETVFSVYIIAA